jgi:hypothetical protein
LKLTRRNTEMEIVMNILLLNLPERVQILGHAHIICITVVHNRIICCQIFCDLLINSAFERIFNVMQLILVKLSGILSKNI